jgi:large subunit ribosomal protein L7Ae
MPKKGEKKANATKKPKVEGKKPSGPGAKVIKKKERPQTPPKPKNPLFMKRPKNFGVGNDIQPPRDLTRFVKWPKYIRLQRQRRILLKRLKVPGVINQFNRALDKHTAAALFNFLEKYKPETRKEKKEREKAIVAKGPEAEVQSKKPKFIKAGIKHVTHLIEQKKAKLVVIAHDVEPIEIVLWLPTLCRKKGVPYVIIKGKARLGKLVYKKTASCLAVTEVDGSHSHDLSIFVDKAKEQFLEKLSDTMKTPGGGIMGPKHYAKKKKEEKRRRAEQRKKKQK